MNREISVKNFNNLINYLLATTTSIEINRLSPINNPFKIIVITVFCHDKTMNDYISKEFNVEVVKFFALRTKNTNQRIFESRKIKNSKYLKYINIYIELVN